MICIFTTNIDIFISFSIFSDMTLTKTANLSLNLKLFLFLFLSLIHDTISIVAVPNTTILFNISINHQFGSRLILVIFWLDQRYIITVTIVIVIVIVSHVTIFDTSVA